MNAAGSAMLFLDLFLISAALHHYPGLFIRAKSCVWQFGFIFQFWLRLRAAMGLSFSDFIFLATDMSSGSQSSPSPSHLSTDRVRSVYSS